MDADAIRFSIFIGALLILGAAEAVWPRRARVQKRSTRWPVNLFLVFLNGFLAKLLLGGGALAVAWHAKENGWGLLNYYELPYPLAFAIAFIILDFMIYIQHVLTHALPFLWRLHIVHHTDLDLDVTSALRFHPIEIVVSMLYKMALVAAIGPDPWVVVVFEIVLNMWAQFQHASIHFPEKLDRLIRLFVISPDMHRIHHSIETKETNSNFGFFLSIWDRICGTYRRDPALPHTEFPIGLTEYRKAEELTLTSLLIMPAVPKLGAYTMKSDS